MKPTCIFKVLGLTIETIKKLNSLSAIPALEIGRVNFTNFGVFIDENLTWNNHINAITKKVSSGIGSIKRISHCVPPATLHTIYHGLVQSHFDYCSVVWGNCAKTLSDKLYRDFKIELSASLLILVMMLTPINYLKN